MNEEIWADIPQYEGKYQASSFGRIRALNYKRTGKAKVMKPGISRGYYSIELTKNGKRTHFSVHTLVYVAFHGPIPTGMQVNHLNEDKLDNRPENLELVTPKENSNWGTRNERLASALRGKPLTEEHKAKISAGHKARHQREKEGITGHIYYE